MGKKLVHVAGMVLALICLGGCAGPTTPFGSVPVGTLTSPTEESTQEEFEEDITPSPPTSAAVSLAVIRLEEPVAIAAKINEPPRELEVGKKRTRTKSQIAGYHHSKRKGTKYARRHGRRILRQVAQTESTQVVQLALPPLQAADTTQAVITFVPRHQVLHDKM